MEKIVSVEITYHSSNPGYGQRARLTGDAESLCLSESAVPTTKDVTDIAELFCMALNQMPLDLPSFDSWSEPATGATSPQVTRLAEL